ARQSGTTALADSANQGRAGEDKSLLLSQEFRRGRPRRCEAPCKFQRTSRPAVSEQLGRAATAVGSSSPGVQSGRRFLVDTGAEISSGTTAVARWDLPAAAACSTPNPWGERPPCLNEPALACSSSAPLVAGHIASCLADFLPHRAMRQSSAGFFGRVPTCTTGKPPSALAAASIFLHVRIRRRDGHRTGVAKDRMMGPIQGRHCERRAKAFLLDLGHAGKMIDRRYALEGRPRRGTSQYRFAHTGWRELQTRPLRQPAEHNGYDTAPAPPTIVQRRRQPHRKCRPVTFSKTTSATARACILQQPSSAAASAAPSPPPLRRQSDVTAARCFPKPCRRLPLPPLASPAQLESQQPPPPQPQPQPQLQRPSRHLWLLYTISIRSRMTRPISNSGRLASSARRPFRPDIASGQPAGRPSLPNDRRMERQLGSGDSFRRGSTLRTSERLEPPCTRLADNRGRGGGVVRAEIGPRLQQSVHCISLSPRLLRRRPATARRLHSAVLHVCTHRCSPEEGLVPFFDFLAGQLEDVPNRDTRWQMLGDLNAVPRGGPSARPLSAGRENANTEALEDLLDRLDLVSANTSSASPCRLVTFAGCKRGGRNATRGRMPRGDWRNSIMR
uniref:Peptidase A2 domain-containing protein n=1 Tax=Macrostomum lignano TaxID=282301 RepID=A0A1I8FEQ7_9PLAT